MVLTRVMMLTFDMVLNCDDDDDKPLQAGQWGWRLGLASATPLIPFLDTPADFIHVMINDDFNHDQDVLCALTHLQFLSI